MDKTPTGIGSSAWWTDPTWPEGGTTVDRRRWVWAKLWTLDMGKLRSLCVTTFPPGTIFEPPAKVEPVELTQSIVSSKQLAPGARSAGLVVFKPPVHDSDQQVVLSISNRAIADRPATYRLE